MTTGDVLKQVKTGDPLRIPAAAYNQFIDVAKAFGDGQLTGRPSGRRGASGGRDVVRVRNDRTTAVGRYGVLGIDGVVFDPGDAASVAGFLDSVVLTGVAPTEPAHESRFCVTLEPIAPGACGLAVVAGAVQVQVAKQTDDDAAAHASDYTDRLIGGSGPAQILWSQPGTGCKWAVVRLGASEPLEGFWGQIQSSVVLTCGVWKYLCSALTQITPGLATAQTDSATVEAYNLHELPNVAPIPGPDAVTRYGNGVALSGTLGVVTLLPIVNGVGVWLTPMPGEGGTYCFSAPNGIDVTCGDVG